MPTSLPWSLALDGDPVLLDGDPLTAHRQVVDYPSVDWVADPTAGAWLEAAIPAFAYDVGSLVTRRYDAYARIRHGDARPGTLVQAEVDALARALARHTSTPEDCWFAVWEGYGWMRPQTSFGVFIGSDDPAFDRDAAARDYRDAVQAFAASLPRPSLLLPHRNHMLYRGRLPAAGALLGFPAHQSPNLWWPADRAWCVATDIDLDATYVGGAEALIADLGSVAEHVAADDPITEGSY